MNNFFTSPASEWDDQAVRLTPIGILTVAAVIVLLISIALFLRYRQSNSRRITTKQIGRAHV